MNYSIVEDRIIGIGSNFIVTDSNTNQSNCIKVSTYNISYKLFVGYLLIQY